MSRVIEASDGLRARVNGTWATQKLEFLDQFGPVALQATRKKLVRVYLDLFAGPGRNVSSDRPGAQEFDGSPIRVLRMCAADGLRTAFTRAVFVNANRLDHEALEARVDRVFAAGESRVDRRKVFVLHGDANALLPELMRSIHPKSYVFAFADIEAPNQWPWGSVEALKAGGHSSVDLYMLFPLLMALNRLVSYEQKHLERYAGILTRFFGTEEWRALCDARRTDAESAQLRRSLEALYLRSLRSRWTGAGTVMDVRMRGDRYLYKMLFASSNEAGQRIATWARERARDADPGLTGQGDFFGR